MTRKRKSFLRWYIKHLKRNYRRMRKRYELSARYPGVTIEDDVLIKSPENLVLGSNILIQKGTILHCGGKKWCDYRGKIIIEDNCYIGPYCVLIGAGEIHIKRGTRLGAGVILMSQSPDPVILGNKELREKNLPHRYAKITLEEGVSIGTGAIVLQGVTIGECGMVTAGAVVSKDVPAYNIVVGGRSRTIKKDSPLFRVTSEYEES